MSKVYTTACVIITPQEIWDPIQKIRQQYDRQIHRWMPHITLLYPFRPKHEFNDLEKEFFKVCSHIKCFEVHFRLFKFFHHSHQNYTIWLNPEPYDLISQLQAELLTIVPDCDDINKHKNGFTPHLSVGQIKGKKNLIKIINKLQNTWKEIKFTLNCVDFISRENNKKSKFEIINKIPLKLIKK